MVERLADARPYRMAVRGASLRQTTLAESLSVEHLLEFN